MPSARVAYGYLSGVQWTNDGQADLARLTSRLWQAAIVAGRLLIVAIALLASWTRWLDAQGQLGSEARESFLPVVVVLCLAFGLNWPYLLLPVSPRRLLQLTDGFVVGDTVLGPRRLSVDGLKVRSFWFPLTKPSFDGQIYLVRDPRGRSLLLLEGDPDRSTVPAAVPDSERSIAADASERPPLAALLEFERQRSITGRERLLGWLALLSVLAVSLSLMYVLLTVVFP